MKINPNQLRYPDSFEENIFWDGDDLHVLLSDDQEFILKDAYVSSIIYDFLDDNMNEDITMCGNNKIWKK